MPLSKTLKYNPIHTLPAVSSIGYLIDKHKRMYMNVYIIVTQALRAKQMHQ